MSQVTISPPPPIRETDGLFEIIDGRLEEKAPMGTFEVFIAAILDQLLGAYVRAHHLGRVFPEMLFKINPTGSHQRRPDVAFVSYSRWPRDRKVSSGNVWDVIPELAIEVISPTNSADEVLVKVREYLQAGVLRVWVIYPSVRQVYVYEAISKVTVLSVGDDLDGEGLLPGFRLSLAELFEDGAEG